MDILAEEKYKKSYLQLQLEADDVNYYARYLDLWYLLRQSICTYVKLLKYHIS